MPANLSFENRLTTGTFYTEIHNTMAERSAYDDLPPTAREFADWVRHQFGSSPSSSAALDCGCGLHAFNIRACKRLGFGRVVAVDVNTNVVEALKSQSDRIEFTLGSVLDLPFGDGE